MKAIQRFSDEYLAGCRDMTPDQIVTFLDDFRQLHAGRPAPSKLISLKVPADLLHTFRTRAELEGLRYQTQIKELMKAWVLSEGPPA